VKRCSGLGVYASDMFEMLVLIRIGSQCG
ncbi:MAG: hypothetical protein RLZZ534_847, partial [Actinomycetota bacterium]